MVRPFGGTRLATYWPLIGTSLAHYEILEALGRGAMGQVYLALDTRLKRRVALKVLPPDTTSDQERVERFEREAVAVAALNHPNIVTVYSVEREGDTRFITMELVEGTTLNDLIPNSGLPFDRWLELARPMAAAVAAAHQRGVTHRDLKPANIMVSTEGRLKVLDFGLAKITQRLGPEDGTAPYEDVTQDGALMGTPRYMAPELLRGQPTDQRTDVFSLGVILYEMAVGHPPFAAPTFAAVMATILRDEPPALDEVRTDLPREVAVLVESCLAKDPVVRLASAVEIHAGLMELGGLEPSAAPSSSVAVVESVERVSRPTAPTEPVVASETVSVPAAESTRRVGEVLPPVTASPPSAPLAARLESDPAAPQAPPPTGRAVSVAVSGGAPASAPVGSDLDSLVGDLRHHRAEHRERGRGKRIAQARSVSQFKTASQMVLRPAMKEMMQALIRDGHMTRLNDLKGSGLRLDLVLDLETTVKGALGVRRDIETGEVLVKGQLTGTGVVERRMSLDEANRKSFLTLLKELVRSLMAERNRPDKSAPPPWQR